MMAKIVLTIAGSDCSGGAGIQADLKTISALGVYGASVITAVTAQNTQSVTAIHNIPSEIISKQITAIFSDLNVDAVKIGMLGTSENIRIVAKGINKFTNPVVLDPVMITKSGDTILANDAIDTLRDILLPHASLLTPNLPEAACLLNQSEAVSLKEVRAQGMELCRLGPEYVLMKGGHAKGDICHDLLINKDGIVEEFTAQRQVTKNTHGTGCTLSSAIAAGLAKGLNLAKAVQQAHDYLQEAIAKADGLAIGHGHGPVHHFYKFWSA